MRLAHLCEFGGKSACSQATLVPSRTTRWYNTSKARSYLSASNEWNLELFSKRALSLKWWFCPTFLGFTTLLGWDVLLGQIEAKKKEQESKITRKMGQAKSGVGSRSIFCVTKTENLVPQSSLLRNHTETFAKQAKSLWPFNPCGHYCCCGPCGRGSCGHCGPCV